MLMNHMDTLEQLQQSHEFGGLPPPGETGKIILGICSMDKKSKSKPMKEILKRLGDNIEPIVFGNDVILNKPVEEWPQCHCLIAFFSDGFPLEKAEAYAEMRKPFLINNLTKQHLLKDRRHVYNLLVGANVPVPKHIIMNRGTHSPSGVPVKVNAESALIEGDDYIEVDGVRLNKPFVEKPVDGEDHNVYIYYPRSAGGGHKRLFRKVGDRSSEFYPDESHVRRNGSFIYEQFLATEGTDVKVYAVTGHYAHAEARKSPVVDGKVMRDDSGHEIRYPIMLSSHEKELARRITASFGQRVCGFDMLRSNGKSYVCDVNGWSFVKKSYKYYDDAAVLLVKLMKKAMGVYTVPLMIQAGLGRFNTGQSDFDDDDDDDDDDGDTSSVSETIHQELRCVVGVVRHGDRTPKQKLKMNVSNERFLKLFEKYGNMDEPRKETKLKSAIQLGDVLTTTRDLLDIAMSQGHAEDDSETEFGSVEKLSQMRTVLEMHGSFKGVNRKVQLKPLRWKIIPKDENPSKWRGMYSASRPDLSAAYDKEKQEHKTLYDNFEGDAAEFIAPESNYREIVTEIQLILKWGGVLTQSGREEAEQMGRSFRTQVYPGKDGLIRLHSTYRHDLKIYSSDEGRVQVTAAAFAKGLLDLEGHLTPILASLVRKSGDVNLLLDDASAAHEEMKQMKSQLKKLMNSTAENFNELVNEGAPTFASSLVNSLRMIDDPRVAMEQLHRHIKGFAGQFRTWLKHTKTQLGLSSVREATTASEFESENSEGGSAAFSLGGYPGDTANNRSVLESLELGYARWSKLDKEFYNRKKQVFDISKIPDIYDCAKFDVLHNKELLKMEPFHLREIFWQSKPLADFVVPQEYGLTHNDKLSIGSHICAPLLMKIKSDLEASADMCNPKNDSETVHRLDKRHAKSMGIKSGERHVRTRLYFTSESHLHSLLNVLRYTGENCKEVGIQGFPKIPIPQTASKEKIEMIPELGYLTHIVFRLYEIKSSSQKRSGIRNLNPSRFRVTVSFSDGVSVTPESHLDTFVANGVDEENFRTSPPMASTPASIKRCQTPESDYSTSPSKGLRTDNFHLHPASPMTTLFQDIQLSKLLSLFDESIKDESGDGTDSAPDSARMERHYSINFGSSGIPQFQ